MMLEGEPAFCPGKARRDGRLDRAFEAVLVRFLLVPAGFGADET